MNLSWLLVGAVYAIAVSLTRRAGIDLPKRVAALFYVLVLLFLFRPLTGPYVSIATDIQQLLPPWSSSAPPNLSKYTVSNIETQDVVMQLVPWAHQVREAWRHGQLPLWNDLAACGYPLISNAQGGALSPLRLLALPLPLGPSIAAEGAMKILIALTYTFLYCRRRGYCGLPCVIGAICFGFGPFLIAWLHMAPSTVACFLPAVMFHIELLQERQNYARFAGAAAMGPLVLFSGHPETVTHMLVFAIACVVWISLVERPPSTGRFLASLMAAGAVSVLLSLPFLLPFAEAMTKSFRFEVQRQMTTAVPFSDFPSLALLVQPRLYGTRPPAIPWGPSQAESITGFAGILGIAGWFGIAFDLVRRRRFRDRETFLIVAAIGVFLVLASWPPVVGLVKLVGLVQNDRFRFVFAWIASVLTAAILNRASHRDHFPLLAGVTMAAATLVWIFVRTQFPTPLDRHNSVVSMMPSVIVLLISLGLIVPRSPRVILSAIGVAITAEVWLVTMHWNPVKPAATLYPRTPLIEAVLKAHARSHDRVVGIGPVLFPNTNALFGIEDVRVLDPMAPARYSNLLRSVMPDYNIRDYYPKWLDGGTPLLDYLNVRWVMTEATRPLPNGERYRLVYAGADGRLYENRHVLPRFFPVRNVLLDFERSGASSHLSSHKDWGSTAILQSLTVDSDQQRQDLLSARPLTTVEPRTAIAKATPTDYVLVVDARRHTLIVSSVGFDRGWSITAGGRKLRPELVNGAFLGFIAPPGHSIVRVHYLPMRIYASFAIALFTLAVLVWCGLRRPSDAVS